MLASLNHPNIAAIYGLEERALAMELVEGETLAGPAPCGVILIFAGFRSRWMNPAVSPTQTMGATQADVILGTAGYMAPEQARGRAVDKRADIRAFGVVLYEMITGRRLFQGDDISETLASVIKEVPRWEEVPVNVRRLPKSRLEKDPRRPCAISAMPGSSPKKTATVICIYSALKLYY